MVSLAQQIAMGSVRSVLTNVEIREFIFHYRFIALKAFYIFETSLVLFLQLSILMRQNQSF